MGARSALIVFVESTVGDGGETLFWGVVSALHRLDRAPWPSMIPQDPNDPGWSFCFNGEPLFIAGHGPTYKQRRSRYFAAGLMLVIQPRTNLAGITGVGVRAERVRNRVRSALTTYDKLPASPSLGIYGDPNSHEWRQYWLPDTNKRDERICPLQASASTGGTADAAGAPCTPR